MIKNARFTEKTLDYKRKLTLYENALKIRCNANKLEDICATHCKPGKENGR